MVKTLFCRLLQLLCDRLQPQEPKNVVTVITIIVKDK